MRSLKDTSEKDFNSLIANHVLLLCMWVLRLPTGAEIRSACFLNKPHFLIMSELRALVCLNSCESSNKIRFQILISYLHFVFVFLFYREECKSVPSFNTNYFKASVFVSWNAELPKHVIKGLFWIFKNGSIPTMGFF